LTGLQGSKSVTKYTEGNWQPAIGSLLADCWQFFGSLLAECWPSGLFWELFFIFADIKHLK